MSHSLLYPPVDDGTFLDHTPPMSSGGEGEGGSEGTQVSSNTFAQVPSPALAPSLTPASQPTISLLTDSNADTLSVESLTLLPPADSPHLHPCAVTLSIRRTDVITEEDNLQEEDGSPLDETETDATVKEETTETVELVTPTDEAPEGADKPESEDTLLEFDRDLLQERDGMTETESVETTEDAEVHTETPDSPELD